MVDNRGVTPISSSFNFKSGDISGTAAKTSEEKQGQGGEYFAQEVVEEQQLEEQKNYQDRSAQLRASLDSLALANAGSIRLMQTLEAKKREDRKRKEENNKNKERPEEYLYDE